MFSFSIAREAAGNVRKDQLATHDIGESRDLLERLRETDEYRDDEVYFRAENAKPRNVREAIQFVQGIFFSAPNRVWLGGDDAHEVTEEDLRGLEKPVT